MRRRFFVERFEGEAAALRGEAAHHLARVLRAELGQLYELSDGECVWLARTEVIDQDRVEFILLERIPAFVSPLRITLLLAIVKFDHFEWALEKATELGVDEIVPLAAERSEKGLVAASGKRAARWRKILLESAQQSRRLKVPALHDSIKATDAFRAAIGEFRLLLSEREGAKPMRQLLEPAVIESAAREPSFAASRAEKNTTITLAIGPEGGWTDAEFDAALASGFAEAALGANILRTETAVCAALASVQYAFENAREGNKPEQPVIQMNEGIE